MELWHPLASDTVYESYPEQAPPVGELFREALIAYSAARRAQVPPPLPPPSRPAAPAVDIVPAESDALMFMLHRYLRRRAKRN